MGDKKSFDCDRIFQKLQNMVLRNVLDEKVFFLQISIVLTCFQSEKSQNKLDLTQNFLLKRLTKLVKINVRGAKQKSHNSVIFHSHFAWIFTKALFYILSRLFRIKTFKKSIKIAMKACNNEWIISSDFKTGSWYIAEYYLPKSDDYIWHNKIIPI